MVSITLGRGAFPLHSPHLKSHHTLMTISQIPTFNPTSCPVLTIVGYLVEHQCYEPTTVPITLGRGAFPLHI
jgi:hypothetical protein